MTDAGAAALPRRWQSAKIVRIVQRTARIKSYFFDLPEPFAYQAGQHVDVRLTAPDGYRAMRSYSIASGLGGAGPLELAIERLDDGEVSPFFHDVAEVGDEIELRGPLGGHFVWSPADGGPLLLIGGGSGVVPLMSMLRELHSSGAPVPAALLLSARTWDEALFRDELIALERELGSFALAFALTREPPRRPEDYGRRADMAMVSEVMARLPALPRHVFVCGSNAFVGTAADGVVAAGVPATSVRTERYGA
ncbi:oxidoreductase [Bosea caraganae]|uniref:Oxidoreductase n=1 Tax=Bosea caraganae TaxID=2763117 RepID=A0A370LCU2_9HYPH|nr:FAD-binding oxidoreductase [Bosea caraganae]RDJ27780.1 oxidoreductase [Bosea caraganae]RDJ29793.1 oxidoreductase [Bosea caraganae]